MRPMCQNLPPTHHPCSVDLVHTYQPVIIVPREEPSDALLLGRIKQNKIIPLVNDPESEDRSTSYFNPSGLR